MFDIFARAARKISSGVQGGIALTIPPCIKKTDQRSNEKARSVYQTNWEMAVVKAAL